MFHGQHSKSTKTTRFSKKGKSFVDTVGIFASNRKIEKKLKILSGLQMECNEVQKQRR